MIITLSLLVGLMIVLTCLSLNSAFRAKHREQWKTFVKALGWWKTTFDALAAFLTAFIKPAIGFMLFATLTLFLWQCARGGSSIQVLPFTESGTGAPKGALVADMVTAELKHIGQVLEMANRDAEYSSNQQGFVPYTGLTFRTGQFGEKVWPQLDRISTVDAAGVSFSPGQLARLLADVWMPSKDISGLVQANGTEIQLTAHLSRLSADLPDWVVDSKKPSAIPTSQVSLPTPTQPSTPSPTPLVQAPSNKPGSVPTTAPISTPTPVPRPREETNPALNSAVRKLAAHIVLDLLREQKKAAGTSEELPSTYEGFEGFVEALEYYYRYKGSGDIEDLYTASAALRFGYNQERSNAFYGLIYRVATAKFEQQDFEGAFRLMEAAVAVAAPGAQKSDASATFGWMTYKSSSDTRLPSGERDRRLRRGYSLMLGAVAANNKSLAAWNNLALYYYDQGQLRRAIETEQACLKIPVTTLSSPVGTSGQEIKLKQENEEKRRRMQILMARTNLGIYLIKAGDFDGAKTNLEQARLLDPANSEIITNLTFLYWAQKQYQKAADLNQSAVESQPHNPKFQLNLAWSLLLAGRTAEALNAQNDAVAMDAKYVDDLTSGLIHARAGRLNKATKLWRRFLDATKIKRSPGDENYLWHVLIEMALGEHNPADNAAKDIIGVWTNPETAPHVQRTNFQISQQIISILLQCELAQESKTQLSALDVALKKAEIDWQEALKENEKVSGNIYGQ